ncbi:hypothetical protein [Pseudomonas aegrilactucae]|uniref:DUF3077 domain-containing protein n=1 Tax=Pseudomonas aegrilactucae TaxID=2854028 RepID=A0A9Q2XMA0_9PSED|nr:hypothetical protein [Pseudomonas aegrilactucae]MBV6289311.1 hypothetical protein [Pseudomonas aegrilactucae]
MLKIVPDPPHHATHSLEDILIQLSEYLLCAQTVSQQAAALYSRTPQQMLSLTAVHELEHARGLVEMVLSRVQRTH